MRNYEWHELAWQARLSTTEALADAEYHTQTVSRAKSGALFCSYCGRHKSEAASIDKERHLLERERACIRCVVRGCTPEEYCQELFVVIDEKRMKVCASCSDFSPYRYKTTAARSRQTLYLCAACKEAKRTGTSAEHVSYVLSDCELTAVELRPRALERLIRKYNISEEPIELGA